MNTSEWVKKQIEYMKENRKAYTMCQRREFYNELNRICEKRLKQYYVTECDTTLQLVEKMFHNNKNMVSAFYRDVWLLCDHKKYSDMTDTEFDAAVRELCTDYQIDTDQYSIWDIIPEIYPDL